MKYSANFKKVIENAKNFSNGQIEPTHLFYGILNVKDSMGYKLLSSIIDIDDAEKKMKLELDLGRTQVDTINPNTEISKLSVDAENIMMQSQLEAKRLSSDIIKTEHLVIAMIRAKIIYNVTYQEAETILNSLTNMGDKQEKPKDDKSPINKKVKTPILDEFSTDLTKLAIEGKLDPVVGRSKEIKRIAQVLSRRKKNNPVLIGEPGCVIDETLITIKKVSDINNHEIIEM